MSPYVDGGFAAVKIVKIDVGIGVQGQAPLLFNALLAFPTCLKFYTHTYRETESFKPLLGREV